MNHMDSQYILIGQALQAYDQRCFVEGVAEQPSFTALREDLVFVQLEILESYLEDLLNLKVNDEHLHIRIVCPSWKLRTYEFAIVCFAVLLGAIASLSGAAQFTSYALTVLAATPLLALYYFAPRSARRRMRFARLLSKEISRRRGHDDSGTGTGISLSDFFIKGSAPRVQGTARVIIH